MREQGKHARSTATDGYGAFDSMQVEPKRGTDRALMVPQPNRGQVGLQRRSVEPAPWGGPEPSDLPDGFLVIRDRTGWRVYGFWMSKYWRRVLGGGLITLVGAAVVGRWREISAGLKASGQLIGGLFGAG
jgi:hypothetical protein